LKKNIYIYIDVTIYLSFCNSKKMLVPNVFSVYMKYTYVYYYTIFFKTSKDYNSYTNVILLRTSSAITLNLV